MIQTGNTFAISSYNLQVFSDSTASWVEVVGETTPYYQTSFVMTENVVMGTDYLFRVRASNVHGFSPVSDTVLIRADDRPEPPTMVSTVADGLLVDFSWGEPVSDNGSTITAYKLEILSASGDMIEEVTHCVSDQPRLSCSIPFAELAIDSDSSSVYALLQGDEVKAWATAYNINGWSEYSALTITGVAVQIKPHQMLAPTSGSITDEEQVHVQWLALTDTATGGSTIVSYNLQWDRGTGVEDDWYTVVGESPYSTLLEATLSNEIVPGTLYKFRVRAANIHGFGDFSDTVTIKAAGIAD